MTVNSQNSPSKTQANNEHACNIIEKDGENVCRICGRVYGNVEIIEGNLSEVSVSGFHTLKMDASDLKLIISNPYSVKIFERQTRSPHYEAYVAFELTCHKLQIPKFLIVEAISVYSKLLAGLHELKISDGPKRIPAYQSAIFCIYKVCKNYSLAISLKTIFDKVTMTYLRRPDQTPEQILNKISKYASTLDLMKYFLPKNNMIHCLYYFNLYMLKTIELLKTEKINLGKFKRIAYTNMLNEHTAKSDKVYNPERLVKNCINKTLSNFKSSKRI